jgi:arylsulfatase
MVGQEKPAFDDDVWELYDTSTDWTQRNDLAKEQPGKLRQLQRLFEIEAAKYNVLPSTTGASSGRYRRSPAARR